MMMMVVTPDAQAIIRSFYFHHMELVAEPSEIRRREFGYRSSQTGLMVRHLSFATIGELRSLIMKEAPSDIYCSPALYEEPEARPMSAKMWSGCDLIFDIDGKSIDDMSGAKDATKALLRGLERFLAIPAENVDVYYSGNKGFHIHVVNSPQHRGLDSVKRAEICTLLQQKAGVGGDMMDAQVTCDIRRIFRMPGTLNGKTGLPKLKLKIAELDSFEPPARM